MKRVFIRASVREMAAATVQQLIGPRQMAAITGVDPEPYFFELVVAHEGVSRGEVVGLGARLKEWGKRVVRAVARVFDPSGRVPARIYDGLINWHGDEDNRLPVGEIVHARVAELAGRTSAQAIGWIFPEQAALRAAIHGGERDCCSLEADVLISDQAGRLVVEDVERGDAVVLGHSSRQMPGFQGAIVRPIAEFGPAESGDAGAESDGLHGAQTVTSVTPPAATQPAGTTPPAQGDAAGGALSRDALVAAIRAGNFSAADLFPASQPTPPAPHYAPVAAPPERPAENTHPLDLTDPKNNPFIPS